MIQRYFRPGARELRLRFAILALVAAAFTANAATVNQKAPALVSSFYFKQGTWQDTMLASLAALEALRNQEAGASKPVMTDVLHGGDSPQNLRVNIAGWRDLYLIVDDDGDYHNDIANWAEARVVAKDGSATFLDTLKPASARQDWGTLRRDNRNVVGGPMRIGAKTFPRGLGTHANSLIHYRLAGDYEWFEASVGADTSRGKAASVRFLVANAPTNAKGSSPLEALWDQLARDFSDPRAARQMEWERQDGIWRSSTTNSLTELARRYAQRTRGLPSQQAAGSAPGPMDRESLRALRERYYFSKALVEAREELAQFNYQALRLAIQDLGTTFGEKYPRGTEFLMRLDRLQKTLADAVAKAETSEQVLSNMERLYSLRQEALLANPLIDFDKLLLVRRNVSQLGLPANWQSNSSLPQSGYDNEIAVLSPVVAGGKLRRLYRPDGGKFVGDLKLHFEADRMLFSSIGTHNRWQVFEIRADGSGLRQVTPGDQPDVDNYDACYLPNEAIIFCSTASMVGVPCVNGHDHVATLYRLEADGRTVRQLGFDQDHNWCPTLLNNGRVLYERWEYADLPHAQSRRLFQMNPDGTGQKEYYGSLSYWPNSMFYARAIPGHPTKVVTVISGHHGVPRMGELVILDPAKGRQESAGAVQRIPGYGKIVETVIADQLVDNSWPKYLHPYPLSERYFLVSVKPTPESLWGIYLVDVFDNRLLLAEQPNYALLEPTPWRKTPRPPVIPDKADWRRQDALVYVTDLYQGVGLKGIPRGAVKKLRLLSYDWAYQGMGGLVGTVGLDGPWDVHRILGTVPVQEDGSAYFRVPANTPISVQPLDAQGKALQLMRSWLTAMPGEVVSCVGCHEPQNVLPANGNVTAFTGRAPDEIKPWYGPARGFSFAREVQPVLDRFCVGCHDGQTGSAGKAPPDLRGTERIKDFRMHYASALGGKFTVSYVNLHRYVRQPGIESDIHLLTPMEFHADTTELVQMLQKGHHQVQLDAESWDRLITWIDLHTPFHGTWHEEISNPGQQRDRRNELRRLYTGNDDDFDQVIPVVLTSLTPRSSRGNEAQASRQPAHFQEPGVGFGPKPPPHPDPLPSEGRGNAVGSSLHAGSAGSASDSQDANARPRSSRGHEAQTTFPGWPFGQTEAQARQQAAGPPVRRTLDLGKGVSMELVLVPRGEFVMGAADGCDDERPQTRVAIAQAFWMSATEISNEQFAQFDPSHDSHVESKSSYQFGVHGYPVNQPKQPVVRVSWDRAVAFCRWLSQQTGQNFQLPTEAQWEYACRAGTVTPFYYGDENADFSKFANLADAKLTEFASNPFTVDEPLPNPSPYEDYIPKDARFNDRGLVSVRVGSYGPNAWGLFDMHGNVWEWTRSSYRPYPYRDDDGRNDLSAVEKKVVRGGSWRDRPTRSRSSFRLAYQPWQRVFNVGLRVVCETKRSVRLGSAWPIESVIAGLVFKRAGVTLEQVFQGSLTDNQFERLAGVLREVKASRLMVELPLERPASGATPKRVPHAVVCLQSALQFHRLTKQAPPEVWLAIDRKARRPSVEAMPIRFVRFSGAALQEGIEVHSVEGVPVRVTTCTKTVADCFKYRNKIGLDVALQALRECIRQNRCPKAELVKCAKLCRMTGVMRPYLEILA